MKDNSKLDCRIKGLEKYSPIKLILDKNLEIPVSKKIFKNSRKLKTFIFYNFKKELKLKKLKELNIKAIRIDIKDGNLNFDQIVIFLNKQGIYRVFIEAGLKFNNFLLKNNYINDFYHFYSKNLLGNNGYFKAKDFFNKMNSLKPIKKEIVANLFHDKLIKFSIK